MIVDRAARRIPLEIASYTPKVPSAGAIVAGGTHGAIGIARSLGRCGIPVWVVGADSLLQKASRYVRRVAAWPEEEAAQVASLLDLASHNGPAEPD